MRKHTSGDEQHLSHDESCDDFGRQPGRLAEKQRGRTKRRFISMPSERRARHYMLFFCPATLQWSDSLSHKRKRGAMGCWLAHNACDD